ncbi:MAG: NINE protein [Humibacillus sp.]|nr:NINE protein [Humibacillus sp.]MDN5777901.1 NINE protein [Humibacillus sp.]
MSEPTAPREIPPGWYPDPAGLPSTRYWDGADWTDQIGPALPVQAPGGITDRARVAVDELGRPVSPRSRLAAALLCGVVGVLGVHRFYTGKVGTGVVMLLTGGGAGIWWLIDFVVICTGSFRDKEERRLLNW